MKLSEAYDNYINEYIRLRHQSFWTIQNYETGKKHLITLLGDIEIESLTVQMVSDFYVWMLKDKCPNTARNHICQLRMVLKHCSTKGVACISYDAVPVPKKEATIPTWITPEEAAQIIGAAANLRSKFMLSLLWSSGIRLAELIRLNRSDVVDGEFIVKGKGQKTRTAFMDNRTLYFMREYLKTRKDKEPALIVSYKTKKRLSRSNVQYIVKTTAERAGIRKHVTPHTFRHGFCTDLVKHNVNLRHVMDLAGHSSLATVVIYTHITNNDLREQYLRGHSF